MKANHNRSTAFTFNLEVGLRLFHDQSSEELRSAAVY